MRRPRKATVIKAQGVLAPGKRDAYFVVASNQSGTTGR